MIRRLRLAGALVLLGLVILAAWKDARKPTPIPLTPAITGEIEYCLTCHNDLPVISPSHPIETFGCVLCHGGERLALNADLAHSSLRGAKNPSDLVVVAASCGGDNCHSGAAQAQRDHIQRVQTSIQTTYAGAIASIRFTFGDQPDLLARQAVTVVEASHIDSPINSLAAFDPARSASPAIQTFGTNCLDCHINAAAREGSEYARFTGCAACHTPLNGQVPAPPGQPSNPLIHRLSTAIPYTQCNACHNRGNYDLRDMTFHERTDQAANRLQKYYQPIAQFVRCEWTLDCIDCHTRVEAMGDGRLYSNKKEIQYNRCSTCHGTLAKLPSTYTISNPNDLALRLAFLNPVIDLQVGDTILVTEKGEPLWNIRLLPDGTYELFGKATKQRFIFRPVKGSACQQQLDQQESRYCHVCHAVER